MIYLATFSATAFLLWASGKCRGVLAWLLVLAALFLPCLIAGVRDETVGVDILSYAKWMCIDAQEMGFPQFVSYESGIASIGWNVFTWLSVKLTGGLPGYLFCIEALCIVPIYMGLRRAQPGAEWIGMLLWLLLEFAFSLNGMRQSVAMGFVFYSANYIFERRPWKFVLWVAVGMLFHQTAVVGFLLYPLARMGSLGSSFKRFFGQWSNFALVAVIAACGASALVLGPRIVRWASVFKESYSYQLGHLGENDFSIAGAYLFVGVIAIWALSRKDFLDEATNVRGVSLKDWFSAICLLSGVGFLAWQLNIVSGTLGRIGYYGGSLLPYLGSCFAANKPRSHGRNAMLAAFLGFYFVVMILVLGKEGAWPYTSQILGIG